MAQIDPVSAAGRSVPDERWRLAHGAIPLGSFEVDPDGNLMPSAELEAICGRGPLTRLEHFAAAVVADERDVFVATVQTPVGAGNDIWLDLHLADGAGDARPVQFRGVWTGGQAQVMVGVLVAVPEDELVHMADLAERYRDLAETSPDIIVVHQGGHVVYANPAAVEHMKVPSREAAIGMSMLQFIAPESHEAFIGRLLAMKDNGNTARVQEEQLVAMDGSVVEVELTSIHTTWEGKPAFQVIARVITERKEAERKLKEQAALIDTVSDAIVVSEGSCMEDMVIRRWSKGAEALYGWSSDEVTGRRLQEVLGFDDESREPWWRKLAADGAGAAERVHFSRDGRIIPVHVSATILRDVDGAANGVVTVSTDISQRKEAEAARRHLEERYTAVVAALEEGVIVTDAHGVITSANAAAERILDLSHDKLIGQDMEDAPWDAVDEDKRPLPRRLWPHRRCLETGKPVSEVVAGIPRGDRYIWLRVNARPLLYSNGGQLRAVVCSLSDITDVKEARDRLAWAATHDALTGLANRAGIADYMERLAGSDVTDLAVLFVDLDRFKMVNDSLGHSAGDQVLKAVAKRLSETVRSVTDVVGRLAGDEFVALCPGLANQAMAVSVAERLVDVIDEPIEVTDAHGDRRRVSVGASVGIAFVDDSESATEALVDADVAMYSAKERGRGRIEIFDNSLRDAARQRLAIREDLRVALDNDGLSIAYQPIVAPDGKVKGYEALVRWMHSERGFISPAEFIPIAEETGLVVTLGAWVLRRAAFDATRWRGAGHEAYVSVNLSTRQVADPGLVQMVAQVLGASGLPADALVLEITESSVMGDPEAAKVILGQLKALGVSLSIDDFGTGYSSLAYLEQFPVDVLKVDRSFVSVLDSQDKSKLVAGIISLAHLLELSVVAEGVETEEQATILAGLGADDLQGYLFGKPGAAPA